MPTDAEGREGLAFSPTYLSQLGQGEFGVGWALQQVAAVVQGDGVRVRGGGTCTVVLLPAIGILIFEKSGRVK